MKRNYLYMLTIMLLSLLIWCSYYFYMELRPVQYENGIFVEVPSTLTDVQREIAA